jgi:hypothetical protein
MKLNQRSDYVSDGLIKVRDKITTLSPQQVEQMSNGHSDTKSVDNGKTMLKALKNRHAEFVRHRRDLTARYSEAIVNFEEDAKRFKYYAEEIDKLQALLKENLAALEELGERESAFAENSTELGEANRTAENYRLELIRQNARIAKLIGAETGTVNNGSSSIIHELASLSFKQLFRLGAGFFMPVCIVVIFSALIVTLAILFSMGIW